MATIRKVCVSTNGFLLLDIFLHIYQLAVSSNAWLSSLIRRVRAPTAEDIRCLIGSFVLLVRRERRSTGVPKVHFPSDTIQVCSR